MSDKSNEKEYIKILKERDKAMPVKQYHFETIDHAPIDMCPICESTLFWESKSETNKYPFCPKCGQRCDRSTIAL